MDFLFLSFMKIGIDMMGGDFAPIEAIKGIKEYLEERNAHIVMIGDEEQISSAASNLLSDKVSSHSACITSNRNARTSYQSIKRKTKIIHCHRLSFTGNRKNGCFYQCRKYRCHAGRSLYALKPIEGVLRPTISTIIPKENGKTGIIAGCRIKFDCKPDQLNQFAVMGSVYAEQILELKIREWLLLNIGEEEGKGNLLAQATYPLLKENTHINFIGNVEGRDILMDKADVMVCDGFTGNIILKMAESLYEITQQKNIQHAYFDQFNFEIYGGTPVLGISKPVIIGHGISEGKSFKKMITLAEKMIEKDVMKKLQDELESE